MRVGSLDKAVKNIRNITNCVGRDCFFINKINLI